jgi:group I intron endonuclease
MLFGIVYLITHRGSGKRYVGITTKGWSRRWVQHCQRAELGSTGALHRAIKKYGSDAFDLAVLETCNDHAALDAAEIRWISLYQSFGPAGYNLTIGGGGSKGYPASDETRAKMSAAKKGRRLSDQCYAASLRARIGVKRDPSVGQKISAALKGRPASDSQIERLRKMAAAKKGLRLTAMALEKMSSRVVAGGVEYGSVSAAASALDVSIATIRRRIACGGDGYRSISEIKRRVQRTPDQRAKMRTQSSTPVIAGGVEYPSITLAAEAMSLTRPAISYRISVGWAGYAMRDHASAGAA